MKLKINDKVIVTQFAISKGVVLDDKDIRELLHYRDDKAVATIKRISKPNNINLRPIGYYILFEDEEDIEGNYRVFFEWELKKINEEKEILKYLNEGVNNG